MKEGDIVLVELLQSDSSYKMRPALLLKALPKYKDFLVCGISTQLHQKTEGFDEILDGNQDDFGNTGLRKTSLIRLLFLAVVARESVSGRIGLIPSQLHEQLLKRLAAFIHP